MTNTITKVISNIRANTASSLEEAQIARIPSLYNAILSKVNKYSYLGYTYNVPYNKSAFMIKNISYTKSKTPDIYFQDTLIDAVANRDVSPFMLFANGALVKWSDITVIKDIHYSYILINKANVLVDDIDIIVLPMKVLYSETNIEGSYDIGLSFDSNGLLNDFGATTYVLMCEDLIKEEFSTVIDFQPYEYQIFNKNILVFTNGLLDSSPLLATTGLNNFTVTKKIETDTIRSMVFCYNLYDNNNTIINTRILSKVENTDYLKTVFTENKTYAEDLKSELVLDSTNTQEQDINAILGYDGTLLSSGCSEDSNIYFKTYSGIAIKGLSNEGIFSFSFEDKTKDTAIIVFVNGVLYSRSSEITYVNGRYNIPTDTLLDADTIEIMHFSEYDNTIYDITVPLAGLQLNSILSNVSSKRIFSNTPVNPDFTVEETELTQYEVAYEISDTGLLTVEAGYETLPLVMVSDRQFHHASYLISTYAIGIEISRDFRYCHDTNKYMIFLNGKKIDRANYTVTVTKTTRPFDRLEVYLSILMTIDDTLDVFYVPDVLIDSSYDYTLDSAGNIIIAKELIKYPLTKDAYMVFVNGKKVNNSQIQDINSTKLKIISDVESVNNVSIVQYLDYDIFATAFQNTTSVWDSITDSISSSEIDLLMNSASNITNTEFDMKSNEVPMRSILYEIMKRYWIINRNDISKTFVYDFDVADMPIDANGMVTPNIINGAPIDKITTEIVINILNTALEGDYLIIDKNNSDILQI